MSAASVDNADSDWIVNDQPTQSEPAIQIVPSVATKFSSMEEAITIYEQYGGSKGFDVRKRSTKCSKRGNEIDVLRMVCSREGNYKARVSRAEGVKKSYNTKRIKGGMEMSQRLAKTCSIYHKKERHNARTCPKRKKNLIADCDEDEEDDELDMD